MHTCKNMVYEYFFFINCSMGSRDVPGLHFLAGRGPWFWGLSTSLIASNTFISHCGNYSVQRAVYPVFRPSVLRIQDRVSQINSRERAGKNPALENPNTEWPIYYIINGNWLGDDTSHRCSLPSRTCDWSYLKSYTVSVRQIKLIFSPNVDRSNLVFVLDSRYFGVKFNGGSLLRDRQ